MSRRTLESRLITAINPKSPISEIYRTLRTNIQYAADEVGMKVIMVTSTQPGEGKTTTISNLAVAYAQEGKQVLLIDADLRKPSLHLVFPQSNQHGLTSILTNRKTSKEVILKTKVENLHLLPSGAIPPNPSELLTSAAMAELIQALKEEYDIILLDSPPLLAVTDSLITSSLCDGVLFIVQEGKVKVEMIQKAKANLDHVKAKIIGVVLNNKKRTKMEASYYSYYGLEKV